ncbi:MAG TPA: VWA domain-containing protein [Pyrinomonadaceae bacterium]
MKKFFLTTALFFLFALNIFPQNAKPVASPTPPDEDIVKISTTLIQIDATVTDKNGKVITDLKPEEVEIYENGKRQEISNFSFVSNVKTTTEASATNKSPAAVIAPPTTVRPEQVRRTIALVVDDLTLSFESMHFVRRALKKFVDVQMQDGDLVAIIRTGAGIGALQQFTNDRRQLYAAIEKVRWNPVGAGKVGAFASIEATPLERGNMMGGDASAEQLEAERNSIQAQDDFRSSIFAAGTLGAINFIVRGMQDLPGRKSVMLLSDGFKLFTKDPSGFIESGRVLDSLRRLVDQANRASVVVYTMDARGLQTLGLTAADDTSGKSADQIEQSLGDRRGELFDTQDGLRYLAKQTGGTAIINNNDLSDGIRRMLDDQSYYLIGYAPDDETFDPRTRRFNKLDVKIKRSGARVRYRSGFFGISDEQISKPSGNLTAAQRINNALTSPFAVNEISLRLNALFGNDAAQGSFVRSFLHVRAQDLRFTDEADGRKKAVFDVLAIGFGDNGVPVDQINKTFTMTIKSAEYESIMKTGFVYDFRFPIKKPGAYQLRIALRDHANDKIGSASQFIEIPNLKKERLTLSSVVLENIPLSEWQQRRQETAPASESTSNPLMDTALRQFRRGTVLNYGAEIYNAKADAARPASLTSQIRIFRDGKLFYEGKPQPIATAGTADAKKIGVSGSVNFGATMTAGEYVLQLIVTDNAAKEKYKSAAQFVQFEIVE